MKLIQPRKCYSWLEHHFLAPLNRLGCKFYHYCKLSKSAFHTVSTTNQTSTCLSLLFSAGENLYHIKHYFKVQNKSKYTIEQLNEKNQKD